MYHTGRDERWCCIKINSASPDFTSPDLQWILKIDWLFLHLYTTLRTLCFAVDILLFIVFHPNTSHYVLF